MQWWDWACIIMGSFGVLAFAMGIRPFAQTVWGRPSLKTNFELHTEGSDRCLIVYLENPPIRHRFLKRLAHRESFQSVHAQYRVSEEGSHRIILPVRQLPIYAGDAVSMQIELPPTFSVGASIVPVVWDRPSNAAFLPASQNQEAIKLESGLYRVDIALFVNGEPKHFSEVFNVGEGPDNLYWALGRAT